MKIQEMSDEALIKEADEICVSMERCYTVNDVFRLGKIEEELSKRGYTKHTKFIWVKE